MSDRKQFRSVNRILGEQPRIGPFLADQVFPWTVIALAAYFICKGMLGATWLVTGLIIAWGWATWWTLTSNKTWMAKFVGVPRITRGYKRFFSVIAIPGEPTKSKKISQK